MRTAVGFLIVSALLAQPKPPNASAELARTLLSAKRIYVDSFGDDVINKALQAMVTDAISSNKRFIVTENKDKADLILKGSSLEKASQELHALGSAVSIASAGGNAHGASARSDGLSDSQASTETVRNAGAAVRLISRDGDVVWSTTQESSGAKYRSTTADIADKIIKQLNRDITKLEKDPQ